MNRQHYNITIYFCLSLFLFGFFTYHTIALVNISGGITLLLVVLGRLIYKDFKFINTLQSIYSQQKLLFLAGVIFLCWVIFVSLFLNYGNNSNAIHDFYKEMRYVLFFSIMLAGLVYTSKPLRQWLINTLAILSLIITLFVPIFGCLFHKHLNSLLFGGSEAVWFFIRTYTLNLSILTPFLMIKLFRPHVWTKVWVVLVLILNLIFTAYSASRGAIGTLLIQFIILLYFYCQKRNYSMKKFLSWMIAILVVFAVTLVFLSQSNAQLEHQIKVRFNTSGRALMIKQRFPLFIEHSSIIHGIGYGNTNYQALLEHYHAPQQVGARSKRNNKPFFWYYHDEPQFLVLFYISGLVGVVLFIVFLSIFITKLYRASQNDNQSTYLAIAILIALIGNTLIRGLFEHTGIINPVFLWIVWLFLASDFGGFRQPEIP